MPSTSSTSGGRPTRWAYAHGRLLGDKIRKFYAATILRHEHRHEAASREARRGMDDDGPLRVVRPEAGDEGAGRWGGGEPADGPPRARHPRRLGVPLHLLRRVGKATTTGHLIQIRALDYATEASIQNAGAILVYKPKGERCPYVVVGWAGMIGCLSGISGQGIAVSEIGDSFGDEKETLAGEADAVLLLREVLERAHNVDEGTMIVQEGSPDKLIPLLHRRREGAGRRGR